MMKKIHISRKEFVWDDPSGLYKACHVSTCLKNENGDLLTAYFGGTKEGAPDLGIWLSRKIDGKWQQPRRIKYMYGFQHWNPVLHRDGDKVLLYYKVGHGTHDWYTLVTESRDFGETWSESREAVPGDHRPRVVTKNNILVADDGRWFGGSSTEGELDHDCFIDISTDRGVTWNMHPIPFEHRYLPHRGKIEWEGIRELWMSDPDIVLKWDGVIQPTLWQSEKNVFHCLMRSSRGRIYRSDSRDGGETWCQAYPTDLPNNNCGINVVQLRDRTLVLFLNPVDVNWGERTPLSAVISEDNGQTWSDYFDLETAEGEYSYPYAVTDVSAIDLTYTWRRKKIVHCEITLEEQG